MLLCNKRCILQLTSSVGRAPAASAPCQADKCRVVSLQRVLSGQFIQANIRKKCQWERFSIRQTFNTGNLCDDYTLSVLPRTFGQVLPEGSSATSPPNAVPKHLRGAPGSSLASSRVPVCDPNDHAKKTLLRKKSLYTHMLNLTTLTLMEIHQ